jgi:hypothetical protein
MDQHQQLREEITTLYRREHEALGQAGTQRLLDLGRQWQLAPVLQAGGVIVFPHAGVADCGQQIAAAVHACLDSGADRVLVISVLHAFSEEMEAARVRVANGGNPSEELFWGIQGPGIPGPRQEWQQDHALISWRHFWQAETHRRGVRGPQVIERYPYLAGGDPAALPGLADPFHHGIGYGDPPEKALDPQHGGLAAARASIETGMELLSRGEYWEYNQHCVRERSDARDAGQVFRYLRGPLQGRIVDLTYSDATELYRQPSPTWVATALIAWEPMPA